MNQIGMMMPAEYLKHKPSDMPQDIWDTALRIESGQNFAMVRAIAEAIFAERKRGHPGYLGWVGH